MARSELEDARWEAHLEAALFCLGAGLLLGCSAWQPRSRVATRRSARLGLVRGRHTAASAHDGVPGRKRRDRALRSLLAVAAAANSFGLGLLIAARCSGTPVRGSRTGGQLRLSGPVLWLDERVPSSACCSWALGRGRRDRARSPAAARNPDPRRLPRIENPDLARPGSASAARGATRTLAPTNGTGAFSLTDAPAADPPREGPDWRAGSADLAWARSSSSQRAPAGTLGS